MKYQREEAFRFTFGTPIHGTFKIIGINGTPGITREGSVTLLDLSPNGLRISSPLNLPINEKRLLLEVVFILNERKLSMLAEPRWKKRVKPAVFVYGLEGLGDDDTKKEITEELKEYSKSKQLKNK